MNYITALPGPILVLGSSGFIGANLFRAIFAERKDVLGTSASYEPWRLEGCYAENSLDMCISPIPEHLRQVFEYGPDWYRGKFKTVFNCLAHGAYPWQTDVASIYNVNFDLTRRIVELCKQHQVTAYVHAGSSSEYGANADSPPEDSECWPNSHYAVSKAAASALLRYEGKHNNFPCYNLRLYSVFGPYENSKRLIPQVLQKGLEGTYPSFVDPDITRDFIYVDDVVLAFVDAALLASMGFGALVHDYGVSINIGTGVATTIREVAEASRDMFCIDAPPTYDMPARDWDTVRGHNRWVADRSLAELMLGWMPSFGFRQGLMKTHQWAERNGGFGPSKAT